MISSLHGLYDDRIYWKEALSLRRSGFDVIHLAVGKKNRDFISNEGIRLIEVKKTVCFRNPYLDILCRKLTYRTDITKKLLTICAQLDAHVYHFHDQQINKIGSALVNQPNRPKVIYDVHEDYYDQIITYNPFKWIAAAVSWYASRIRKREIKMSRLYDAVIAAVPYIAGIFSKQLEKARVHVVYNYTTLAPDKIPEWENKTWDAVYAGLINETRGGLEMIEAAAIARKSIPDFSMLLVGPVSDAQYRSRMMRRIESLRLKDYVILKEAVPYNEVEPLLLQSRIGMGIFMPVRLFYYGIQVKTFEYMACGLPVICSNFGTIHDLVSGCHCGISVDSTSPGDIAQAMISILTDRELYRTCSNNGMKAVREKYNWATEEKKLISIYQTILKE